MKRSRERRGEGAEATIAVARTAIAWWAAQTPQVFRTAALRDALAADPRGVADATDEAMVIERAGGTVLIDPAPAWNLKATTAEDLRVAELPLSRR